MNVLIAPRMKQTMFPVMAAVIAPRLYYALIFFQTITTDSNL